MKLSLNRYYITFGLIGWILLFTTTLGIPKIFIRSDELMYNMKLYFWVESILCGLFAFLCSYVISLVIDYKLKISNLKQNIWKLAAVFIGVQLLYSFIIWPILDFAALQIRGTNSTVTFEGKIFNFFYFITLYFVWFFVFLTIKIYHQLKTVKLKQIQLESNLKESQLNTLKGQINPHFMFNSLNNIRGLMLEDVDKSRVMLTSLSETLRYSLTKSDSNSIALEDELEMIENYVAISKIQFEDRLIFTTHIDKASLNIKIPPMIIQMLVENAIKHGISNLKEGGEVQLISKIEDNQLRIEVSNTGQLNQNKNGTQLGLQNIERRLELLYGEEATFNLRRLDNKVVATIKIPLK
ncbi:sensor histidine kinase [Algibacter aquimarinus]|uniref:Signal transduction histidine kinase internal region domain-containing protein n=1 Tax=Algibacter aquimarinus TaxID=1136748 RepID=A0ABP9H4S3_9FLAO